MAHPSFNPCLVHTFWHMAILKIEGNVWYEAGLPNLSTSILSLSKFSPRPIGQTLNTTLPLTIAAAAALSSPPTPA